MFLGDDYREDEEDIPLYRPSASTSTNADRCYDTITIESDHTYHLDDSGLEESVVSLHLTNETSSLYSSADALSKALMFGLALSVGFASMDISLCYRVMNFIGAEFQQADLVPWIHGAYLLCGLTTLPLAGYLTDMFGRKPVLLTFTVLLLLGSWATGFSHSMNQIILARAMAGIGGGGLQLMGNVIVHDHIPLGRRGPYQACITMAQTLGVALGAPLGQRIHEKWGWHYCFALNSLPLLLSIALFYVCMHQQQPTIKSWRCKLKSIDFVAACFLSLCSITLVMYLLVSGTHPRDPLILVMVSLSGTSFVILGLYEYYYNYGTSTMLHMPRVVSLLMSKRNVTLACIAMFLACFTDGMMFLIPYYFEGVVGLETGEADAWFLIETLAVPMGCVVSGYTIYRTGTFKTSLVVYGLLSAVGLLLLSGWMVSGIPWVMGTMAMACVGFAMGNILVSLYMGVVSEIQESEVTLVMVIVTMVRFMAYCVDIAVSSSIIQRYLKSNLLQRVDEVGAQELLSLIRTHIQRTHALSPDVQTMAAELLGKSLEKAFFWISGSMALATLMFALMRNVNLTSSSSTF